MELLFVVLIGLVAGLVGRATLPRRALLGVLTLPAIGGAAAAVVWVALFWAGLPYAGALDWLVSIVCAGLSVAAAGVLLGRVRERADEVLFARVNRGA